MPELPEVETIRRQLEKLVVGKTVSSIEVLNPGSFRADLDSLIGKTITGVGRNGKVLTLSLQNDLQLFVHLKMSGQLEFRAKGQGPRAKGERPKHLRVCLNLNNGDRLLFHDQRKFGWITDNPVVLPRGIDALDPQLTPEILVAILTTSRRPIKQILLDQSKIAGIGNIYASEILWEAKISPLAKFRAKGQGQRAKGRNNGKFVKLLTAIREILNKAIDSGGSTMRDQLYRHISGRAGDYWSRRRVYDREGEPCLRCKTPIKKSIISQRSTYFCPNCQE